MSRTDFVELLRAAARGYDASGRTDDATRCWNWARRVLGKPPRKDRS